MPTYDYLCGACGHAVEFFQSMSEAPKKKCPKCGKSKLVRQLGTGAGILFKGSGFYQTDYRSDAYKKAASADTSGGGACGGDPKTCAANGGPCAATPESKPSASKKK
ncbi:MAG: zinc ribbon domain-containing protein [Planctomycetes bacterium]|nr:zinc ribbon domain-containing protein [Planctomycetota bacterium]